MAVDARAAAAVGAYTARDAHPIGIAHAQEDPSFNLGSIGALSHLRSFGTFAH